MTTTRKAAKRIDRVRFVREVDTDPDMSYLGEYKSSPGAEDRTIDREERGDMGRNEFRYFIAAMSAKETGNPESVEQDYKRAEAMNRGEWWYVGIRAEARIVVGETCQRITSGGLWGIESDSGADYFAEVQAEELANLKEQLMELGFSRRAVSAALKNCEDSDE